MILAAGDGAADLKAYTVLRLLSFILVFRLLYFPFPSCPVVLTRYSHAYPSQAAGTTKAKTTTTKKAAPKKAKA